MFHRLQCLCLGSVLLLASMSGLSAADYHVSPSGADTAPGTQAQPWKTIAKVNSVNFAPGDRVLFEGGQTFAGTLSFDKGDGGSAINRVTISSYGNGRATIQAGTQSGIVLTEVTGVNVRQLNLVGDGRFKNKKGNGIQVAMKSSHVDIDQCDLTGFQWAGVLFGGACSDLRITHTVTHHNGYAGITSRSGGAGMNTRIYVGHCVFHDNYADPTLHDMGGGGQGIEFCRVDQGTIEFCRASNNGGNEGVPGRPGGGPVAIWANHSRNLLIQYCIANNNTSNTGDGGGFDLDWGIEKAVLQYNYSYGNKGPGFLICPGKNLPVVDSVIRYNISENDGMGSEYAANICWAGGAQNTYVYNNVFYNSGKSANLGNPADSTVFNNICIRRGSGPLVEGLWGQAKLYHNLYWHLDGQPTWVNQGKTYTSLAEWANATGAEKLNDRIVGIYADPLLTEPGGGEKLTDPTKLTELRAYRLQAGSPAVNAALSALAQFGKDPGTRDFHGNAIPHGGAFDIGAHEYGGAGRVATPVTSPEPGPAAQRPAGSDLLR